MFAGTLVIGSAELGLREYPIEGERAPHLFKDNQMQIPRSLREFVMTNKKWCDGEEKVRGRGRPAPPRLLCLIRAEVSREFVDICIWVGLPRLGRSPSLGMTAA